MHGKEKLKRMWSNWPQARRQPGSQWSNSCTFFSWKSTAPGGCWALRKGHGAQRGGLAPSHSATTADPSDASFAPHLGSRPCTGLGVVPSSPPGWDSQERRLQASSGRRRLGTETGPEGRRVPRVKFSVRWPCTDPFPTSSLSLLIYQMGKLVLGWEISWRLNKVMNMQACFKLVICYANVHALL